MSSTEPGNPVPSEDQASEAPAVDVVWHRLIDGDEIDPGMIVEVAIDGDDAVVWRSTTGVVCVMEARCPHQFSHLAVEGSIDGEEIVCCTHYWRFSTAGDGSYVDARGGREDRANIGVWASRESEGTVWIRPR